ncbi:MAG: AGE family epimerase/isomerase, partial [Victivallales bacterium]|nr:AGE family epimerase/isomerase [Victivallales bacterium]
PENIEFDFKSKDVLFSWIQGRGLEALVGHYRWLERSPLLTGTEKEHTLKRIKTMTEIVLSNMESLRSLNGGRLPFMMTTKGRPLSVATDGRREDLSTPPSNAPANFSDLFYAKGLAAAGSLLDDSTAISESKSLLRLALRDIENNEFRSDQISFDPKNKPSVNPAKRQQGPGMIAIGALALFTEIFNEEEWVITGKRFCEHILNKHVSCGQWDGVQLNTLVEAIDESGNPWKENDGGIVCDPGHSNEFVGLSAKLAITAFNAGFDMPFGDETPRILLNVLTTAFKNGWNDNIGGICKTYDARTGTHINSDMPWWPLPETIRAASSLLALPGSKFNEDDQSALREIIEECAAALKNNFVNEKVHSMAYQTVSAESVPIATIPATPDADPGYHTGLSLIDYIVAQPSRLRQSRPSRSNEPK